MLLKFSGGTGQKVLQNIGGSQQILRIPVSSPSPVSSTVSGGGGQLQKIQIGNKVQYIRVISSGGQKSGSQNVTIRSSQTILPSTTKTTGSTNLPVSIKTISTSGSQNVVKIALPPNYQQTAGVRKILLLTPIKYKTIKYNWTYLIVM